MRQLGTLPNQEQTRRFVDFLLTEGIATRADEDGDGWLIWVVQEDDFEKSKAEYARFQESPDDERYQGRADTAEEIRAKKLARIKQAKKNLNVVRPGASEKLSDKAKRIPITFGLILVCVAIAFWTHLGKNFSATDPLMIVSQKHQLEEGWNSRDPSDALIDIKRGQVWRLLTPALLHFGPLHLIFNMLWLHQLGGMLEMRKGRLKYTLMLIALAIFSNLFQVYTANIPLFGGVFFGGMSGVVYGLFGFIWMKGRYDSGERFQIDPWTVKLMLIWFVACFLPFFGVANGGHAGGLILGAAMGYVSAQMR